MATNDKSDSTNKANESKVASDPNDSRDVKGLTDEKSEASGQNALLDRPVDDRDFKEQSEAVAREGEKDLAPDYAAGDEYLYPELPISAQNPPKRNIIAYKVNPSEDSDNA